MKPTLLFMFFISFSFAKAQDIKTSDFFEEIKSYDISNLLTTDKIYFADSTDFDRKEPIGFIGRNFQRFYIHIISVIKNPNNGLEYFIFGKTKVKDNICTFQGVIQISESKMYDQNEISTHQQGFVKGEYEFFEDPDQLGSGILKGDFQSNFFIDKKGELKYNALMFAADGFHNNQFEGSWESYKTGKSKKCNWGDYRIPDSGYLDIGAGEFSPSDKYKEYGWDNYIKALGYSNDKSIVEKARLKEKESWWMN